MYMHLQPGNLPSFDPNLCWNQHFMHHISKHNSQRIVFNGPLSRLAVVAMRINPIHISITTTQMKRSTINMDYEQWQTIMQPAAKPTKILQISLGMGPASRVYCGYRNCQRKHRVWASSRPITCESFGAWLSGVHQQSSALFVGPLGCTWL